MAPTISRLGALTVAITLVLVTVFVIFALSMRVECCELDSSCSPFTTDSSCVVDLQSLACGSLTNNSLNTDSFNCESLESASCTDSDSFNCESFQSASSANCGSSNAQSLDSGFDADSFASAGVCGADSLGIGESFATSFEGLATELTGSSGDIATSVGDTGQQIVGGIGDIGETVMLEILEIPALIVDAISGIADAIGDQVRTAITDAFNAIF